MILNESMHSPTIHQPQVSNQIDLWKGIGGMGFLVQGYFVGWDWCIFVDALFPTTIRLFTEILRDAAVTQKTGHGTGTNPSWTVLASQPFSDL